MLSLISGVLALVAGRGAVHGVSRAWELALPSELRHPTMSMPAEAAPLLATLNEAAATKSVDDQRVVDALLELESTMRRAAKEDAAVSTQTRDALDGAWQLVFTTGTVDTQKKLGTRVNYFPVKAVQTFDTSTMEISNGIFFGDTALLKFFGIFEWDEKVFYFSTHPFLPYVAPHFSHISTVILLFRRADSTLTLSRLRSSVSDSISQRGARQRSAPRRGSARRATWSTRRRGSSPPSSTGSQPTSRSQRRAAAAAASHCGADCDPHVNSFDRFRMIR